MMVWGFVVGVSDWVLGAGVFSGWGFGTCGVGLSGFFGGGVLYKDTIEVYKNTKIKIGMLLGLDKFYILYIGTKSGQCIGIACFI